MKNISDTAWLKKNLVYLIGSPLMRQFEKASFDVVGTQEKLLMSIVDRNRQTLFGKEHSFAAIKTTRDFQKAVPIRDFESHRPYINRMIQGEADILIAGKPIAFNITSGTTDKPKYIPVSQNYYNSFGSLNRLWFYSCLRDNPTLFNGHSLSAVAPAVDGYFTDGTPYGSTSGHGYKSIPAILKRTYSSPYSYICIRDYIKKYYALVRGALSFDISYIVCPSPSNVLKFHQTVVEHFADLVKDIRDGTLRPDVLAEIEPEKRASTLAFYKPDPRRARQLEAIMREHGNNLVISHYWPNVACVNTWKQGNFHRIIPSVKKLFGPTTAIREFGYQASEARAGLVLGNDWDYSLVATTVYYFEFIPEDEKTSPAPRILLAHELEAGKRYFILITNNSGLYRYDINDLIEVRGFYHQMPLIAFIRKGEGMTSLTGEKLSEIQVMQAIDDVAHNLNLTIPFFTMFCDEEAMRYILFVEFPSNTSRHNKDIFGLEFDIRLREINPEYEIKRGSQRLDAPILKELLPDSYTRFKEMLITRGLARDGQFKDAYLRTKQFFLPILNELSS
jgi:hypothetical protein